MVKKKKEKVKTGRPVKFNPDFHPQIVKWMCRSGLTDVEIANELGIAKSTLNEWKKRFREFSDSLKQNKNFVDSLVEDSLLKKALGYEFEETEVTMNVGEDGQVVSKNKIRKLKKHITPDTTAQIFWLKNRQRLKWRDKIDHDHSGTVALHFDKEDEGL